MPRLVGPVPAFLPQMCRLLGGLPGARMRSAGPAGVRVLRDHRASNRRGSASASCERGTRETGVLGRQVFAKQVQHPCQTGLPGVVTHHGCRFNLC